MFIVVVAAVLAVINRRIRMQSELVWISDPGHAWLRVPIGDYFASGIQASRFSYVDAAYVYLEEDRDAELYLDAARIPWRSLAAEPYAFREIYFDDVGAKGNPRHLDRIIQCHGCTDPTAHTPTDLGIGGSSGECECEQWHGITDGNCECECEHYEDIATGKCNQCDSATIK